MLVAIQGVLFTLGHSSWFADYLEVSNWRAMHNTDVPLYGVNVYSMRIRLLPNSQFVWIQKPLFVRSSVPRDLLVIPTFLMLLFQFYASKDESRTWLTLSDHLACLAEESPKDNDVMFWSCVPSTWSQVPIWGALLLTVISLSLDDILQLGNCCSLNPDIGMEFKRWKAEGNLDCATIHDPSCG